MDIYKIIVKPLVTEKSTEILQDGNWDSFHVHIDANPLQLSAAVETIFDVKVLRVNTGIVRGKQRRFGKSLGVTQSWQTAVLRLKDGDKIELFEGV